MDQQEERRNSHTADVGGSPLMTNVLAIIHHQAVDCNRHQSSHQLLNWNTVINTDELQKKRRNSMSAVIQEDTRNTMIRLSHHPSADEANRLNCRRSHAPNDKVILHTMRHTNPSRTPGSSRSSQQGYFKIKEHQLKRSRFDHGTGVLFQPSNVVKASYSISLLFAKQKKPHTIGEKLVKPCMVEAARLVLDQNCVNKLNQISLSDNTVKQRIDDMSQDIKSQVIEKIKLSPFFAIQLDETTDIAHLPQLLVYSRFISENQVGEFLFCRPLITTTKAEDIMNIVSNFFKEEKLSWAKLVGVCRDGAPSMLGSKSGFMTLVKTKNPDIITTHCLIHCEALASEMLPAPLKDTLETVIRIVNHIKGGTLNTRLFCRLCQDMDSAHQDLLFYTSVRWLSKGNVLARVFEL
ncbi:protein FAM200C-like [Macrobrachium rosenbergii]|uniref:protein FAM200C-like n=1 Tax=Macrobrachium rosenbergii TaxID=79674 RepID=UPI0034D53FAD